MTEISVNVKGSGELKFTLTLQSDMKIIELKSEISKQKEIPEDQQRIIFAGKILKDEDTLDGCNIKDGCTIHLVRSGMKKEVKPAPSTPSVSAPSPSTNASLPGGLSLPSFASMGQNMPANLNQFQTSPEMMRLALQMMQQNPQMMQQMMQNNPYMQNMTPEMQQMMTNPQFIESMLQPGVLDTMTQMMQGHGAQMPMMGMGQPVQSNEPPEIRFEAQLQQLQEMGFYDAQENIQALQMTNGNVNAAIEMLISRRF